MSDLERRLFALEQLIAGRLQYDLQQLKAQIQTIANGQRASGSYFAGNAGAGVYYCLPTAVVPVATANPPSGTPGSLTGQSVYQISAGAYVLVTSSATIYNPSTSNTLTSGKLTVLGLNSDGTYSAQGQVC